MEELDQQVVEAAARAVETSSRLGHGVLDYSEGSLATVESLLAEAADFLDGMPEDRLDGLVQDFGCYILEVDRRRFGGTYCWYDQREQPVLVVGEPAYHLVRVHS